MSPLILGSLGVIITICLAVDLYSHRRDEAVRIKDATLWSLLYIVIAIGFAWLIRYEYGDEMMVKYLTGYLLEKMLSVDNLFVFIAIFSYFGIEDRYQHRILHWGILGAVVMRTSFVALGAGGLLLFGWVAETILGLVVLYTAYLMWVSGDQDTVDYESQWYIRLTKRWLPVTAEREGHRFFIKYNSYLFGSPSDPEIVVGPSWYRLRYKLDPPHVKKRTRWMATPLFLCLVAVEVSDVLFAFDSVPAVLVVVEQFDVVLSAILFAIIGLRSLYFVLTALKRHLRYLEPAVIVILIYIGVKMLVKAFSGFTVDPLHSLAFVMGVLTIGIICSAFKGERDEA